MHIENGMISEFDDHDWRVVNNTYKPTSTPLFMYNCISQGLIKFCHEFCSLTVGQNVQNGPGGFDHKLPGSATRRENGAWPCPSWECHDPLDFRMVVVVGSP